MAFEETSLQTADLSTSSSAEKEQSASPLPSTAGPVSYWTLLTRRALVPSLVSVVALIPCFWLPRIEAGDLPSHSYNAWLASLIEQGKAPGLWIAPQKNNILFDILLQRLGSIIGFAAGEKVAVCMAVLVFLWGAYCLASTIWGKPAWFLLPVLVVLSYGWTFQMGFFNFYLSLGISFAALAVFWRARGLKHLYVLPILPLLWLAHPLGLFWFAAVAFYVYLSKLLEPRWQLFLAAGCLACVLAIRFYLARHYEVQWWPGHSWDLLGTDQVVLGVHYQLLPLLVALAIGACIALHLIRMRADEFKLASLFPVPVQLYLVLTFTVMLLPNTIWFPQYGEPVTFLSSRFTLTTAILGCCAASGLRPRTLFGILTGCVALTYFFLIYQDAAKAYAMEKQAGILVSRVPQDARVITTIFPFRGSRVFTHHVPARACIGHCFVVDNYEPASRQFRLRASPGNRIAAATTDEVKRMSEGIYLVQPEDLPLWQILQCGPTDVDLCLRPLRLGSLQVLWLSDIQRARQLPR